MIRQTDSAFISCLTTKNPYIPILINSINNYDQYYSINDLLNSILKQILNLLFTSCFNQDIGMIHLPLHRLAVSDFFRYTGCPKKKVYSSLLGKDEVNVY